MRKKWEKWIEEWEEVREKRTMKEMMEEIIEKIIEELVRVEIKPIEVVDKEAKPIEQPIIVYGCVRLENGDEVRVKTKHGLRRFPSHKLLVRKYYPVEDKKGRIPFSEVLFLPLEKVDFSKVYATIPPLSIQNILGKIVVYEFQPVDRPAVVEYIKGVEYIGGRMIHYIEKEPVPLGYEGVALEPGGFTGSDFIDIRIRPDYVYTDWKGVTHRGHLYREIGRSRRDDTPIVGGKVRIRVKAENLTEKERDLCQELAGRIYEEEFSPRESDLLNVFSKKFKPFYNAVEAYKTLLARELEQELYHQ